MSQSTRLASVIISSTLPNEFLSSEGILMSPRVMLVDDEADARTLIGIMLQKGGYEAVKVSGALEALALLELEKPDLFILDVMMPDLNGIDLCRRIRLVADFKRTPILILSARGDSDSVEAGLAAGANDYLLKPILYHQLIEKVEQVFAERS